MGFYIRKSVSLGPFRFNLSKSGVGVSAGTKGFRLGSGPRGNYVHMGRHGLYYRASLPSGRTSPQDAHDRASHQAPTQAEMGEIFEPISSGDVHRMVDSSSADLLQEINAKREMPLWWIPMAIASALLGIVSLATPSWATGALLAACVGIAGLLYWRDQIEKSTVLLYDLDDDAQGDYDQFHSAFERLIRCDRVWHVVAAAGVGDRKRNAGASALLRRKVISPGYGAPPYMRTNIDVPFIPSGATTLYFFPDRLLVYTPQGVGAVSYQSLQINVSTEQFIESDRVPRGTEVVGHTWQYVNRDGGPDRRFGHNPQIPIVLYENVHLTSPSGLNERYQFSARGTGEAFEAALRQLIPVGEASAPPLQKIEESNQRTPLPRHVSPKLVAPPQEGDTVMSNGNGAVAPSRTGTFTASVSGAVEIALHGTAVFGIQPNMNGDDLFILKLLHGNKEEHQVRIRAQRSDTPDEGRYTLQDDDDSECGATYSYTYGEDGCDVYFAKIGKLHITKSSPVLIEGSFEFQGEEIFSSMGWDKKKGIRIFGTFTATRVANALESAPPEGSASNMVRVDFPIVGGEVQGVTSLERRFADRFVEIVVAESMFPSLLNICDEFGPGREMVDQAEAFIFASFSLDLFTRMVKFAEPHTEAMREAIFPAIGRFVGELRGIPQQEAAELVTTRFRQYRDAIFDETEFFIREDATLAIDAYQNIIGGQITNYAAPLAFFEHFSTMCSGMEHGAKMRELYDLYLEHGEDVWDGVRQGLGS